MARILVLSALLAVLAYACVALPQKENKPLVFQDPDVKDTPLEILQEQEVQDTRFFWNFWPFRPLLPSWIPLPGLVPRPTTTPEPEPEEEDADNEDEDEENEDEENEDEENEDEENEDGENEDEENEDEENEDGENEDEDK